MTELLTKEQVDQLLAGSGFNEAGKPAAAAAASAVADSAPVDKTCALFCEQASGVLETALHKKAGAAVHPEPSHGHRGADRPAAEPGLVATLPFTSGPHRRDVLTLK